MPDKSIHRSSGNVFEDLDFAPREAEHLRARAELMIALSRLIEERGLTQVQAAEIFGVAQSRVSAAGRAHRAVPAEGRGLETTCTQTVSIAI